MNKSKRERYVFFYRLSVIIFAAGIIAHDVVAIWSRFFDYRWVTLAAFAMIASWVASSELPSAHSIVTVSDAFVFLAILLLGSEYATMVVIVTGASDSLRHIKRASLIAFNVSIICSSYFLSGLMIQYFFGDLRTIAHQKDTFFVYALALALFAVTQTIVNSTFVLLLKYIQTGKAIWNMWRENYPWVMVSYFSGIITACMVDALIAYFGFWTVVFIIPVFLACYFATRPYIKNIEAAQQHVEELNALHLRTMEAFATAVDAKDQITHEHVKRVQIYAEGLARLLNLSDDEIRALHAGALLHDIGKIAVPDYILNKPGKLTAAEFDKMKIHTIVGSQILERIGFPYPLGPVVRHHHERWDGNGYPDGLRGEEIPITARILTVVDCFDAVREDRQYRKGLTREQAIELLLKDKGKHYEPKIVDLFIDNLPKFEEQVAQLKQGELAFSPVHIEETEAIRKALPAAGLMEKQETETGMDYLQTIRDAHQSSHEMLALYEIAQTLNSSLNSVETVPGALKHLEAIIPFTSAVFYQLDEETGTASATAVLGANAERITGHRLYVGEGVTGWVLANNAQFANTDPKLDLAFLGEACNPYRTLVVQPLQRNNRMFGAIALYTQALDSYKEKHLRALEQVSLLFSDALHNESQFNEIKSQAMTDSLTGLPNMRYLRAVFEQQVERQMADNSSTTVMLIDVDCFKKVNKAVGRHNGDKVLKEIAELLRAQIRKADSIIRFASDKFIAVIHGATSEVTGEVAVRLQSSLYQYQPEILSETDIRLTVSLGQAQIGQDGYTLEELIEVAERRLIADKAARHSFSEFESVEYNLRNVSGNSRNRLA
jgi:diguanylate cyclase (GGDEF)-like protein/putative nucleotidyltransferase with HDIG domain